MIELKTISLIVLIISELRIPLLDMLGAWSPIYDDVVAQRMNFLQQLITSRYSLVSSV